MIYDIVADHSFSWDPELYTSFLCYSTTIYPSLFHPRKSINKDKTIQIYLLAMAGFWHFSLDYARSEKLNRTVTALEPIVFAREGMDILGLSVGVFRS
jgi:hypothetical protein